MNKPINEGLGQDFHSPVIVESGEDPGNKSDFVSKRVCVEMICIETICIETIYNKEQLNKCTYAVKTSVNKWKSSLKSCPFSIWK